MEQARKQLASHELRQQELAKEREDAVMIICCVPSSTSPLLIPNL
jgi:hypothetical protein